MLRHMTLMTHKKITQVRAYCRALPHWTEDGQASACEAWAIEQGLRPVVYRDSVHGRGEFMRALRSSDLVLLPRIDVLAVPMGKDKRPSVDLSAALGEVTGRAGRVVELYSGAEFGVDGWPDAVAKAASRTVSGRSRSPKYMRKIGRKGGAVAKARSVVNAWHAETPEAEARLEQYRVVWRSLEFDNYRQAQARMPPDLRHVSRKTLERIFGPRLAKR